MTSHEMPVNAGWVWMLRAAAVYNVVVGVAGLAAPAVSEADRIVSLLVACFGLVYAMVSRSPVRFGPVLWAGVVGKLGVLVIMVPAVMAGRQPAEIVPVLVGDALFTAAFLAFLLRRAAGFNR